MYKAVFLAMTALLISGCHTDQIQPQPKPQKTKPKVKRIVSYYPGDDCNYHKAVIVSIKNGLGEYYSCEDSVVTSSGLVSAGRSGKYQTPLGTYCITWQKREHDSTKYPSTDGTRNMDFASFFHPSGIALHAGSVYARSHGCVHLQRENAQYIYENFGNGDKVIVQEPIYQ